MAAKTIGASQYSANLLALIFNGTPFSTIATSAAAGVNTLYVSLHTSSAGLPTGNQTTNEATYGSYGRVSVARTPAAWTVGTSSVAPAANITFVQAISGSETETYFGVGTSAVGVGSLFYWGPIAPTIAVSTGVQPILTTATTVQEV